MVLWHAGMLVGIGMWVVRMIGHCRVVLGIAYWWLCPRCTSTSIWWLIPRCSCTSSVMWGSSVFETQGFRHGGLLKTGLLVEAVIGQARVAGRVIMVRVAGVSISVEDNSFTIKLILVIGIILIHIRHYS